MDELAMTGHGHSRLQQVGGHLRQHGAGMATEAVVNFLLPLLIYDWAKPELGEVKALLASSAPPLVWSAVEFARRRRVDALSMLVLVGIALSLLAFVGSGSAKALQLREAMVGGAIALIFLGSAAIRRPLIYQLARAGMKRRNAAAELAGFEALQGEAMFRRTMMIMTLVWGFGLMAHFLASCALVFALTVHDYLLVGPPFGYATMGALGLWTAWYARRQRRRGEALRAAAAAGSPPA